MNVTIDVATARRQQAEGRLAVIRNALTVADEELERALVERDWEVFGLASFGDYCAEMLPELRHIKLRPQARRERAKVLHEAGATEREIAAATGSSAATAHRDVLAVTGRPASNEASTTPPDGRPRPINPRVRPGSVSESRADQIVRLVAAAGIGGLTVQELCAEAGLHHGQASGGLSRVHRQGRVVRTDVYRNGCAAYTV